MVGPGTGVFVATWGVGEVVGTNRVEVGVKVGLGLGVGRRRRGVFDGAGTSVFVGPVCGVFVGAGTSVLVGAG